MFTCSKDDVFEDETWPLRALWSKDPGASDRSAWIVDPASTPMHSYSFSRRRCCDLLELTPSESRVRFLTFRFNRLQEYSTYGGHISVRFGCYNSGSDQKRHSMQYNTQTRGDDHNAGCNVSKLQNGTWQTWSHTTRKFPRNSSCLLIT